MSELRAVHKRCQVVHAAGLVAPYIELMRGCLACTLQTQRSFNICPAQRCLFNDLHHTHTFAVHGYDLHAAFMQNFSELLAGIVFLQELLASKISKDYL